MAKEKGENRVEERLRGIDIDSFVSFDFSVLLWWTLSDAVLYDLPINLGSGNKAKNLPGGLFVVF